MIIANTSNMPMMAREASIYTGITVAEYFRDMGHVALYRRLHVALGGGAARVRLAARGVPGEEGYPAYLASALAAFYERAGQVTPSADATGSVTVIGAVSPPGGDLTEPVTAHTERFVRCRWTLDRDLAYSRHYPRSPGPARSTATSRPSRPGMLGPATRRGRCGAGGSWACWPRLTGWPRWPTSWGWPRCPRTSGSCCSRPAGARAGPAQNSLSANDAYCTAEKAAALVEALISTVDALLGAVAAGVPAADLEQVDYSPLLRAGRRRPRTVPVSYSPARCPAHPDPGRVGMTLPSNTFYVVYWFGSCSGFVIPGVHLAGTAVHEQPDDGLGAGREVGWTPEASGLLPAACARGQEPKPAS